MKIAIIGTGIAGLGAAHALGQLHDVELFEATERAGGHAHTVTHDSLELDTGFIVHNEANYPQLTRLFRELGVETQPSEMSFAMSCGCGLEWSSKRPWRAGPRLLHEILRFLRTAGTADTDGKSFEFDSAGKRLRFDCHVLEVRLATAEEVEHGHVHGPGAHHHH